MSHHVRQQEKSRGRWLFLLYLCDDYEQVDRETVGRHELCDENDTLLEAVQCFEQIEKLRAPVDVVYQFDSFLDIDLHRFTTPRGMPRSDFECPDQHCLRRYLRWQGEDGEGGSGWEVARHASYKSIDTGKTETLKQFFEWAERPIRDAAGIVVVFAGLGVGDKRSIVGNVEHDSDYGRLFSICDDKSAKDALSPIEVQYGLEMLVNEYRDGEPIDVLGFDMSSMQFIEVAYQFMGLARTVVASQNNGFDPFWPYAELLRKMSRLISRKERNGNYIGPGDTGNEFVRTVGRKLAAIAQRADRGRTNLPHDERPIVSAIDVGQLDVVARSMDTLFLNLLQSLGDNAIWEMRDAVFRDLKAFHRKGVERTKMSRGVVAYDLRHMLLLIRKHLHAIRDVRGVLYVWCNEQLRALYDPDADDPLFDRKVARDESTATNEQEQRTNEVRKWLREQVWQFLWTQMGEREVDERHTGGPTDCVETSRLWRQLSLLNIDEEGNVVCPKLDAFERRGNTRDDLIGYPKFAQNKFTLDGRRAPVRGLQIDALIDEGNAFLHQLKERFERLSVAQLERSAATARHLLSITDDVIALVSPPPSDDQTALSGFRRHTREANRSAVQHCIIAQFACADESNDVADSGNGLPTPWQCGISIYRPEHLDRLAESQYLDFAFHRRVHWVSLLAAVNLIRKHAGQLWNVVSSLLSTCTGEGRDELLRRLAGPNSVMDRFGKQFQVLQNPLTLTLTVTEDQDVRSAGRGPNVVSHETDPTHRLVARDDGLFYKLTLETNLPDAFVDTSKSSLNRHRAQQAIERLEAIINPVTNRGRSGLDTMESYARDLGEDIFQGIDLEKHCNGDSVPHLHLQLPIALMGLTWEVMNDGFGGLCERFAISRQAIIEAGTARPPGNRTSAKIRILIIGDPLLSDAVLHAYGASQLSGAVDEAHAVEELFRDLKRKLPGTVDLQECDVLIHKNVTGHDVRQLIRMGTYDIIHFAGHAMFNEAAPDRSSWLMSDGELHAQEIANTLKNCTSRPWLVYANACESAMSGTPSRKPTHRTNVYGLGTAFTNNGVTAYLGPLWPIGDYVAEQMATDFYQGLLLERATIGEALFVAKRNAKQRLEGALATDLSWAGMIVYGDSRMKLLDSLGVGGSSGAQSGHGATSPGLAPRLNAEQTAQRGRLKRLRKFTSTGQPIQPMQASVRSTRQRIDVKGHPLWRAAHRRQERLVEVKDEEIALELRQINGLRYWQFVKHDDDDFSGLPGSPLRRHVEANQRLRYRIGIGVAQHVDDVSRIVGHWRVPVAVGHNVSQWFEPWDRRSVDRESVIQVGSESDLRELDPREFRRLTRRLRKRPEGRILLLLHDAFGSTRHLVDALGPDFIRRAAREYVAVLGFDHWSLQRSAVEIADQLWDQVATLLGAGAKSDRRDGENVVDVIGVGRGGLVARMLAEGENVDSPPDSTRRSLRRKLFNTVALVGTPSFGSRLAVSDDWGIIADLLANCAHLDTSGYYAQMSFALAQLAALSPFHDQHDLSERAASLLLADTKSAPCWPPNGVRYGVAAAAFAPAAEVAAFRIVHECCAPPLRSERTSRLPFEPHDLVVATNDVWAPTSRPLPHGDDYDGQVKSSGARRDPSSRVRNTHRPAVRTLLIEPDEIAFYAKILGPTVHSVEAPSDVDRHERNGVHHTNLISCLECQQFLRNLLFGEHQQE